ncbi:hypothetical protein GUITHDRAFT_140499 [Guillardia theta CCMP2712]|uniref:Uncharacterized protein n=1 Tax=Guillardia theta (strain CCMP2712) TaxID=905079 RepID=L1J5U6_GUITC|nr:hypothetical protein GUITHDRAFT_140499 [Guillardia theta CCMP2712]EKX43455.1 hypothetical protein GUITHDRAFT_140499 [Guillardia theta CCMP2712]|eukprot:XP_005830435.1 hypothetical protein GUITHDRAFT_140499 [Guillardia theta CCMP2712]
MAEEGGSMLPGETFETPEKSEYLGFSKESPAEANIVDQELEKKNVKPQLKLKMRGDHAGGKLNETIQHCSYLAHTITVLCLASCFFLIATREYRLHMGVTQLETEECKLPGNVEVLRSIGCLFAVAAFFQLLRYLRSHLVIKELVHDAPLTFSPTLDVAIFISWYAVEGFILMPVNPPFSNYEIDGNVRPDGMQSRYHADCPDHGPPIFSPFFRRVCQPELPVNAQLTGSDFYFFWYGGKGLASRGFNVKAIRDSVRTVALAFFGMLNEQSYAQSHFGQIVLVLTALLGTVWAIFLFIALLNSWWKFQRHHDNSELLRHSSGKLFPSLPSEDASMKQRRVMFERTCAIRAPSVLEKFLQLAELVRMNQSIRSFRRLRMETMRAAAALRPVDRLVSSLDVDNKLQHTRSIKTVNQAQQIYSESAVKISGLEQRSLNAVESQEALAQSLEKVSSQVLTIHSTVSTRFNAIEEMIEEVGRSTVSYHSTEFFQDDAITDHIEQSSSKSPVASNTSETSHRRQANKTESNQPPTDTSDVNSSLASPPQRGMLARLKAKSSNMSSTR